MKRYFLLLYLPLLVVSCSEIKDDGTDSFYFPLNAGEELPNLQASDYIGRSCTFGPATIGGRNALKLTTSSEFSDGFLEVGEKFGRPVNFRNTRYLNIWAYVPSGSWIAALKLNFEDARGNFGGIPEVANAFPGRYDEWFPIVVDLDAYRDRFRIWHGDEEADVLSNVTRLSFNPYCANQEGESSIYFSSVKLSVEPSPGNYPDVLLPKPPTVPNVPYEFTFDDDAELQRQIAYRTFEASNQAFAKNVAGNPTRAIRMRGRPELNNIAFLPIISAVTGQPADFTGVSEIYFDYYLEPGHDAFDGSTLYLTSEHWNDILMDTAFYDGFTAGAWNTVRIPLAETDLVAAKGDGEIVLPAVHELRLNLNYRAQEKNITMWIDNFGWR